MSTKRPNQPPNTHLSWCSNCHKTAVITSGHNGICGQCGARYVGPISPPPPPRKYL